jgi:hypothetical protein
MLAFDFDVIGYTLVKVPLVINCAHVYPLIDFTYVECII